VSATPLLLAVVLRGQLSVLSFYILRRGLNGPFHDESTASPRTL